MLCVCRSLLRQRPIRVLLCTLRRGLGVVSPRFAFGGAVVCSDNLGDKQTAQEGPRRERRREEKEERRVFSLFNFSRRILSHVGYDSP